MLKKYKCDECGADQESESVPDKCECGTEKLAFTEIVEKEINISMESFDKASPMDVIIKGIADINIALKSQMEKTAGTDAELKELKDKVESELAELIKDKDNLEKTQRSRKGEFDEDYESRALLAINKGRKNSKMSIRDLLIVKSDNDLINDFQSKSDDIYILSCLLDKDPRQLDSYQNLMEDPAYTAIVKAMFDSAGSGGEWVPDILSAQMIELIDLDLKVASIHPRITMPSSPFKFPGVTNHLKTYRRQTSDKGTDAPSKFKASTRATRELIFIAELLATRAVFDTEFEEDSIIPVLQGLKKDMAYAAAAAIESTIINGDTDAASGLDSGGTDMHGDNITDESPEASWDGYRKLAATINSGGATAVTDVAGAFLTSGATLRDARANMVKYGINPNQIALVVGVSGYLSNIIALKNLQTIDKYGPKAVVITGEVAKVDGIPVVISEYQRENLNASGLSSGVSSNSDTAMQLVHRQSFVLGDRRKVTIESVKIPGTDSVEIWSTWRGDFQTKFATSEAVIHNIIQP